LAADEVEASGGAQAQRDVCREEVKRNPGKTAAEIAAATGLERHAPSRRLPELREDDLVTNGRSRICAVTRRLSMTWFPVSGCGQ
jgi:CRP-like cAMP-binding protein